MAVDIIALSSEASDFIANEDVSKGSNSDVPTTSYVNGTSLGIDSETWEVELVQEYCWKTTNAKMTSYQFLLRGHLSGNDHQMMSMIKRG